MAKKKAAETKRESPKQQKWPLLTDDQLEPIRDRWIEIYTATRPDDEDKLGYDGITSGDDVDFADFLHGFLRGQGVPERQAVRIAHGAPHNDWPV